MRLFEVMIRNFRYHQLITSTFVCALCLCARVSSVGSGKHNTTLSESLMMGKQPQKFTHPRVSHALSVCLDTQDMNMHRAKHALPPLYGERIEIKRRLRWVCLSKWATSGKRFNAVVESRSVYMHRCVWVCVRMKLCSVRAIVCVCFFLSLLFFTVFKFSLLLSSSSI